MTIRNLVHGKWTHFLNSVILTIVILFITIDWAMTFTGYLDMLTGAILAWTSLIIFIIVTTIELIALVKNKTNLLATIFIIALIIIYTLYITFSFPDFIEGRTDTLV